MSYFRKRYHSPGTAPGTLTEGEQAAELKMTLVDYTSEEYMAQVIESPEECRPHLKRDSITWIHVQGDVPPQPLQALGELFELHPLAMEDVLNHGQRAKVECYEQQLFVVLNLPIRNERGFSMEQVSLFLDHHTVVSFYRGEEDPFLPIRERLRRNIGRIRKRHADYLLYALLDRVIDEAFPLLELLGDEIEDLEEVMLEKPSKAALHELHRHKRELMLLRRSLWPQREAISQLLREEQSSIEAETKLYLRDCYDHTIQIMDLVESFRDMTTGLLDLYLSSSSNHMNESMRVLTVIATIFIPLTFVAGVYGMNFNPQASPWSMPELSWAYGYPAVWLLMLIIAMGLMYYFKRKGWF